MSLARTSWLLPLATATAIALTACGLPAQPSVASVSASSLAAAAKKKLAATPLHDASVTGDVEDLGSFTSRYLSNAREVWVYLPPGYHDAANAAKRYPVLYMHDGQNLFDASLAFGGNEWHADETAQKLIEGGQIPPMIIVGVGNTADRIGEYTWLPGTVDGQSAGGEGAQYAQFLVKELKPQIDGQLRTLTDADHTAVLGSSLGGLMSFYLGVKDNAVFHTIGVMSPSIWWDNEAVLGEVPAMPTNLKIWLDIGGQEGDDPAAMLNDARQMEQALVQRGYTLGQNLGYYEDAMGGHNELAWAYRLPMAFQFLFGQPANKAHR